MKENIAHSSPTTELAADFKTSAMNERVKLSFNPQPQTEKRTREGQRSNEEKWRPPKERAGC